MRWSDMPLALQQNQSKVRQKLDLEDGNTHASRRVCQKKKKWCTSFIVENPRFPVNWRLLVKECITNFDIPLDVFLGKCRFNAFRVFFFLLFWFFGGFCASSLQCILGELSEGGSVAVAVDRVYTTHDIFTDSALWNGSVIESTSLFVWMSVCMPDVYSP